MRLKALVAILDSVIWLTQFSCIQPKAYDGFVASDLGFDESAVIVARLGLPSHPSIFDDLLDASVMLFVQAGGRSPGRRDDDLDGSGKNLGA